MIDLLLVLGIQEVAFSAHFTKHLTSIGHNQILIFDGVDMNLGNAYDSHAGVFTAPVNGYYGFTWTIFVPSGHWMATLLEAGGKMVGASYSDARDSGPAYDTASNTVFVKLNKGDHVFVQRNADYGDYVHSTYSTFGGWLLH